MSECGEYNDRAKERNMSKEGKWRNKKNGNSRDGKDRSLEGK